MFAILQTTVVDAGGQDPAQQPPGPRLAVRRGHVGEQQGAYRKWRLTATQEDQEGQPDRQGVVGSCCVPTSC